MPYITDERKREVKLKGPLTPGELNYAITMLALNYYYLASPQQGGYALINEIMGAMECAKLEFYRRVAVPYEEQKKEENGDVY